MPLPKRQAIPAKSAKTEKSSKASRAAPDSSDSRFANFESDARFRLPSKKQAKTKLDPRFSRLRSDPDFYNKATVDKYGRKISKDAGKKALAKQYDVDSDEDGEQDEDLEGLHDGKRDKSVLKELARVQKEGYDPIRDGMESSSDESSSDEEEEEVEEQVELAGDNNEVPTGDISSRLAAVNMDWDNIRASDIMAVANSFVPADGRILNVVIYPSEFGMERMQREEIEGPPREIFASAAKKNEDNITTLDDSDASDVEDEEPAKQDLQTGENGEEFDSTKLRSYQLDRLRYYYAVITCSSANVAKSIYDNLDGREYLTSANFFDLRFVPDGTEFDQDPHDECTKLADGYKPNEFTTDALTHSKVKLTWDAEDTTRKEVQKRAFSRKEIDENELKAYLGTDSESSEDEEEAAKTDKAASLRAALGLEAATKKSKSKDTSSKRDRDFPKPEGEMQITFSGGLLGEGKGGSVFENEIPLNETTIEKHIRKEKERKAKRRERMKAKREGRDPDAEVEETTTAAADGDDPFNDPFFASDGEDVEKAARKADNRSKRAKKREEKEAEEAANAAERAKLELLMADDEDNKMRHFNMNEIEKAEKAKKKGKKGKKNAPIVEDTFKIDTADPRFAKLYESHEFAIDPTNPRFKETSGMKALLEEGRKKRKQGREVDEQEAERQPKKSKNVEDAGDVDIKKLAARVKAKSKQK
ncbi:pre-rRNA-processing protein esf1 [Didymella sp. IMI 355093]|nr:pre-rRNA-processing protein esf1 [Didymella sp. IMI 355093]